MSTLGTGLTIPIEKPGDSVALEPYGRSLVQFCRFVETYTRLTSDPLTTAAVCEDQAEAVRITRDDLTPETIDMLLETLLNVITELERRWYEERLCRQKKFLVSSLVPWKWVGAGKRSASWKWIGSWTGIALMGWLLWFLFNYVLFWQ